MKAWRAEQVHTLGITLEDIEAYGGVEKALRLSQLETTAIQYWRDLDVGGVATEWLYWLHEGQREVIQLMSFSIDRDTALEAMQLVAEELDLQAWRARRRAR